MSKVVPEIVENIADKLRKNHVPYYVKEQYLIMAENIVSVLQESIRDYKEANKKKD